MAYAFNRIDNLLKKNYEDEDLTRKFSRPAATMGSTTPESYSNEIKDEPRNLKFNKQASASAAFNAMKTKAKLPGFLGSIRGDIESRRNEIRDQAKKFAEAQKAKTGSAYKFDIKDIQSAIGTGDAREKAFKRIKDILGRSGAREIEGPELSEPSLPRGEYLTSREGIKELYSKKRTPSYTPGMAEFDINVLQGNPNFSSEIGSLVGDQKKLVKEAKDLYNKELETAKSFDEKTLKEAKDSINKYLAEEEKNLTEAQVKEAEELSKELEEAYNLTHAAYGGLESQLEAELARKLKEEISQFPDEREALMKLYNEKYKKSDLFRKALSEGLVLPYERGRKYSSREMYDNEEADKFNRIMALLGKGESRLPGEVEKDINKYLKYNKETANPIFENVIKDRLKQYDEIGNKHRAFKSWDVDPDKFTNMKNFFKYDTPYLALSDSIDYIKKHTGKDLGLELRNYLKEQMRDMARRGSLGTGQAKAITNFVNRFPQLKKYTTGTWKYDMNLIDKIPTYAMVDAIANSIKGGRDSSEHMNRLSHMFANEGKRNPYKQPDLWTINSYYKTLGAPPVSMNNVYGKKLLLENPEDPGSYINNLNSMKALINDLIRR